MPSRTKLLAGLCSVFFLLLSSSLFAQTKITGRIIGSSDKQPIAGATVQAVGGKAATLTSSDGTFELPVTKAPRELRISVVGYQPMTVPVTGDAVGDILLTTNSTSLNDVIVTGYTSQRKRDVTGAVAVVSVKDMKNIVTGSPEQMLQGQAAGVTVITSGAPGGPSNVFIRGVTNFGNSDPLYVIDGVPGAYHDLNAQDIESVQVLKDAGSASIYGVRGSNGVVVITTKRGKSGGGRPVINYDGYVGTQRPVGGNPFHLLNTSELASALWKASIASGQVGANGNPNSAQYGNGTAPVIPDYILPVGKSEGDPSVDTSLYNVDYSKGDIYQITKANKKGTDWFHALFKPATITSHSIGVNGGGDKSTYYFGAGYFDQQGTLLATYLKRYSMKLNTTFALSPHIRVGENLYFYYKTNPQISYFGENTVNYDYREQPIIPVYDVKGNYAGSAGSELGNSPNPVANQLRSKGNHGNEWNVFGNVFAEVDLLKHITLRTSFGGTVTNEYDYSFGYHTYENAENNGSNSFTEASTFYSNKIWTNTLNYNQTFGAHSVKLLLGTEAITYYGRTVGGNRINYFNDNPLLWTLSNGDPKGQVNFSAVTNNTAISSLFGQFTYAFKDRYILSGTLRRDGASVFGPDNRYGTFPAISAGWVISDEKFMSGVTWINFLKLRASWGKLGSYANTPPRNQFTLYQAGPANSYYDIGGTSNSTVLGFYNAQAGNVSAGWEEDQITNVGLDAVVVKNKLDFSIEYYQKKVKGLLFQGNAAATSGVFPSSTGGGQIPFVNIGDVQNNGVDFSATFHQNINSKSRINITGIITTYKSKVVSVPNSGGYFTQGSSRIGDLVRNQEGHPIGAFYGYKVIGYFSSADDVTKSPTQDAAAPGRFKYADINNDGKISDSDRTFFGNPNPKFTYGLNINGNFGDFDAAIVFYGSYGNDVLNYTRYWLDHWASFQGNKSKNLLYNSWTPTNLNPKAPILENASNFSNNSVPSSFYNETGSFLKLRSLIIGYTIPNAPLKNLGITKLRIYIQGSNLFQITKYTGLDPEVGGFTGAAYGIDYGQYPNNQRNYNVGISLGF